MTRFLLLAVLILTTHQAFAQTIYQWVDENGRTHYGNKPKSNNAVAASLPEIQRQDIDKTIDRIRDSTPRNCINHGGHDCSQGPDVDGSVICYDGYRDARRPYRFACAEARLSINNVQILLTPENLENQGIYRLENLNLTESESIKGSHISMLIRNDTGITARNVSVTFKTPQYGHIKGNGPSTIEPHGVAEYILKTEDVLGYFTVDHAKKLSAVVRCENCNQNLRYSQ